MGCQENIISILRIEVECLFILKSSQYNLLSSVVTNRNQLHSQFRASRNRSATTTAIDDNATTETSTTLID